VQPQRFAELGVATSIEAAGGEGLVSGSFLRITPGTRAAGPARIAVCGSADNLAAHRVLEAVQEGDVVVLVPVEPRPVAVIGELMASLARARGAVAVLVDGPVRDVDDIAALGVPVWARSVSAAGPAKSVRGELDVPVTVGGVTIAPGDIVVLDGDGVGIVPRARADEVLAAAEARAAKEAAWRPRFAAGELSLDVLGLRDA
jgi:4-hydroxy-4-methyl-2-oxoglutarate aldolase